MSGDPYVMTHHRGPLRNLCGLARSLRAAGSVMLLVPLFGAFGAGGCWTDSLSPQVRHWLKECPRMLPERVPADARWMRFEVGEACDGPFRDARRMAVWAWLIGEDETSYRVIDWRATSQTWPREGTRTESSTLAECASWLMAVRQAYNATNNTDERGAALAKVGEQRFMRFSDGNWDGCLPEILVAAWSYERGDKVTAAKLLQPLLSEAKSEQELLNRFRDQVAVEWDIRMLHAFAEARDYAAALRLAQGLSDPWFDGFCHQDRAKGLAAQLPSRGEDFKTLYLPDSNEWNRLKADLTRDQQIDYLAARLRLIYGRQNSIPGGIRYDEPQQQLATAGPRANGSPVTVVTDDELVNPYVELLRMNLSGGETARLLPLLASDDYILAYDLERFIPNHPQTLHRVRWVAASIICEVAQQRVVDPEVLDGNSEAARQEHMESIRRWCKSHATARYADRLVTTLAGAEDWQNARCAFWSLYSIDETRAARGVFERLQREPARKEAVTRLFCLLDRQEYLAAARQWMSDEDPQVRCWGSLLVLRHDKDMDEADRAAAVDRVIGALRQAVRLSLKERANENKRRFPGFEPQAVEYVNAAIDTLIACRNAKVDAFIEEFFGIHAPKRFTPSSALLQRLFLIGHEPTFHRLVDKLGDQTPVYEGGKDTVGSYLTADLMTWRYGAGSRWTYWASDEKDRLRSEMVKWLSDQFDFIRAGKPTSIHSDELEMPWGDWKEFWTTTVYRF